MKKTFTLLAAAVLMVSAASAQWNRNSDNNYGNGNREVVVSNDHNNYDRGGHFFGEREKQMQIDQINYSYDKKIQHVANNFFMGRYKKECKIAELKAQRDTEISCVVAKFNEQRNHFADRDDRYKDHDRRNW